MSNVNNLNILRSYAQKSNPASLPASILFDHTPKTLTIFDIYRKSIFHFLVLPRASAYSPLTVYDLANLRSLLRCKEKHPERVKEVLVDLGEVAKKVKVSIEEEMMKVYGFKWDIWTGFHPVPSMEHLHLHVMSADLCSTYTKTKKHYNSFHPKLGFFQHYDKVLSWLDAEPIYFRRMSELKKSQYEPLLKEDLICFHCREGFKNMPKLKEHLQQEWKKIETREKAKLQRAQKLQKRKREAVDADQDNNKASDPEETGSQLKKQEHEGDIESSSSP